MTKRKPRSNRWQGRGRGYREVQWCVSGLVAPGRREPIDQIAAPSADDALVLAREGHPHGFYPLSVQRADGAGVVTYEL